VNRKLGTDGCDNCRKALRNSRDKAALASQPGQISTRNDATSQPHDRAEETSSFSNHLSARSSRELKMSTLADELLQDFEDSGSENGEQPKGLFDNDESFTDVKSQTLRANGDSMELDGDEEEVGEDEEMSGLNDSGVDVEDEEETKAKVEKMELGGVDDVRSVAKLMKTLEPVLEVSNSPIPPHPTI
jgi:hypothetical protein